ncbi:MAG: prepilin-type N-terminal cleavage/methylation domain-containing protein [Clostridia bacterium]|nr:prepilin-type N-terminal cleavage/methylation domain-containing protein [Clostridia bacterium]
MFVKFRNNRGFSLIELILAITLLALVTIPFIRFFSSTIRLTRLTQSQVEINAATRLMVNRVTEAIKDKHREIPLYDRNDTQSLYDKTGAVASTDDFYKIPEFDKFKFKVKDPFATGSGGGVFKFTNSTTTVQGFDAIHMLTYFKNTSDTRYELKDLRFRYFLNSDSYPFFKPDGSVDTNHVMIYPDGATSNFIKRPLSGIVSYDLSTFDRKLYKLTPTGSSNVDTCIEFGFNAPNVFVEKNDELYTYVVFRYVNPNATFDILNDYSYNPIKTIHPDDPGQSEYTKVPVVYKGKTILGLNPPDIVLPEASYLHIVNIDVFNTGGEKVQRVQIEVTE